MAKSLVSHPWELNSAKDANTCVSDNVSIRNALTENMSAILKRLDLSDNFWTLLLQHSVVDASTMRRIQDKQTKALQAQTLMLHVMEVQVYKFHGFIWALVNSHQCDLAQLLGFDVHDYLDVEVFLKSSTLLCPACREFYTKAYILTGCGHYVCAPCVKGAQFMCKNNQKEDVTCPVPECGIKTEASPSDGNIGLEEDGDFSILCQAVLKETTNESGGTTEGKSTTGREDEGGKPTGGRDELEEDSDWIEEEGRMSTSGSEGEEEISSSESDEEEETTTWMEDEGRNPTAGKDEVKKMASYLMKLQGEISITSLLPLCFKGEEITTGMEDEGGNPTAGRDEVEEMPSNGIEETGEISTTRSDKGEEITIGTENEGGNPTAGRDVVEEMSSNVIKEEAEISTTRSVEEEKMTIGSANTDEVEEMSSCGIEEEEGMSTSGSEVELGMSLTVSEEKKDNLSQHVQDGIRNLGKMIPRLKRYSVILEKHEPGIKAYIRDTVEKARQNIDEWEKETLGWYSSFRQQVENNVHKVVKWQKAASELSILVRARPSFLEGHLKGKVNLPKESVTVAGETLIYKLNAGWPIPRLLPRFPYISIQPTSNPPVKAKFLLGFKIQNSSVCLKLAWMPDGSLMVLTAEGVWRLDFKNIDTAEYTATWIWRTNKATDISVADDGTWILNLFKDRTIEVHYPGQESPKLWKPEGVIPCCVFINNKNIYVAEHNSPTIRSYSRELVYVDQYDMGHSKIARVNIHVTKRGIIMRCTGKVRKIYMMHMQTKKFLSFGSKHKGGGRLVNPRGVCTVNEDEYILVCDKYKCRVSVFTRDGQFIHHLDVDEYSVHPYHVAVLSQRGKPSLMALDGEINKRDVVGIYSLE